MAGAVAGRGAPTLIRSCQQGYTQGGIPPVTATILPVVPENCVVLHTGFNAAGYTQAIYFQCRVELTNATTVSIIGTGNSSAVAGIGWQVVEFVPGIIKSMQAGVIDLGAANNATATIQPVLPERCLLTWMGIICNGPDANAAVFPTRLTLTNATTITANRYAASGVATSAPWRLVEFF
jgi:hypothetical protein